MKIYLIPFACSNYFYPLKKRKSANSSFPLKHFSLFFFRKYSVYMILHIVCTRCKLAITCYVVIRMPTVQRLDLSHVRFTQDFPRCDVFISSSPIAHQITFIYSRIVSFSLSSIFIRSPFTYDIRKSSSVFIYSFFVRENRIHIHVYYTSTPALPLDAID